MVVVVVLTPELTDTAPGPPVWSRRLLRLLSLGTELAEFDLADNEIKAGVADLAVEADITE